MRCEHSFSFWGALVLAAMVLCTMNAAAQTESVIYSFSGGSDGLFPYSNLIVDAKGNLYGTTLYGGGEGTCVILTNAFCGSAYELTPVVGGGWQETVLHGFGNGTDGMYPEAGLVLDKQGNLYGTTAYGGSYGEGVVFKLIPLASGGWQERVIYNFTGGADGGVPVAGLIFDNKGNLYGTTSHGGTYQCGDFTCGTVFELSLVAGKWQETVIHTFTNGSDGATPLDGLIFDKLGNLYGTANFGGTFDFGTVFELSPITGGWQETTLYAFQGARDGYAPQAGLVFDTKGDLFGTTYGGGPGNAGEVYELTPAAGVWSKTRIYGFSTQNPRSNVVFGPNGNIYGVVSGGQLSTGYVYDLTPTTSGQWTLNILHTFTGTPDGMWPYTSLIFDKAGNLYGTTYAGGANPYLTYGAGAVYEVTP